MTTSKGSTFNRRKGVHFQPPLTRTSPGLVVPGFSTAEPRPDQLRPGGTVRMPVSCRWSLLG
jgi:hypothetical protein